MLFEETLIWLRQGKRARADHWAPGVYIVIKNDTFSVYDKTGLCQLRFNDFTTVELLTDCWKKVPMNCTHCKGTGEEPEKASSILPEIKVTVTPNLFNTQKTKCGYVGCLNLGHQK